LIFRLQELPNTNETLDYLNVNLPFIVADKNSLFLEKYAEKLLKTAESFRIYTDKDLITVNSDGIKDKFYFDYDARTLISEGYVSVKALSFKKETVDFSIIGDIDIVNLEETSFFMVEYRFIPIENAYSFLLKKDDVKFSNILSKSDITGRLYRKTDGAIQDPEIFDLTVSESVDNDSAIISYGDAKNRYLHKTDQVDKISITGDNITTISSDTLAVSKISFGDDFQPIYNDELVSVKYMDENVFKVSIESAEPIFCNNSADDLYTTSPINKEQLLGIHSRYISRTDNKAHNIIIGDDREYISPENVLSYAEAQSIVSEFFSSMIKKDIGSIDEFKEYLRLICDSSESVYLEKDAKIDGTVFLGFDYNSMDSIFNSEAISKILLEYKGEYDKSYDEKTFMSARYFKNQDEISRLSAYAERLGIDIDISRQRMASTFDAIRRVVAKLCLMTPDVVQPGTTPDFPVIIPTAMKVIGPVLKPIVPNVIIPRIIEPVYNDVSIKLPLIVINPQYAYSIQTPIFPTLFHSVYSSTSRMLPVFGPTIIPNIVTISISDLSTPRYIQRQSQCYVNKAGRQETMVVFSADNDCRERYIGKSTRTINMIDVAAIIENMDTENMYGFDSSGYVIPANEVVAYMVYQTLMCVSSATGIPTNIDFCDSFIDVSEVGGSTSVVGFCSVESSDSETLTIGEVELPPGKYLKIGGMILDEAGNKIGTTGVYGTEWHDSTPINLSPFAQINGDDNAMASKSASDAIISAMNEYLDGIKISDLENATPHNSKIGGFEQLRYGHDYHDRVFMLDYVEIEAKDDAPEVYSQGGNADSLGIFKGLSAPIVYVSDVADSILAISIDGISVPDEDGTVLRILDESIPDESWMNEAPYYVISPSDSAMYADAGKLIMIEHGGDGPKTYEYDTSQGYSVEVSTRTLLNSAGEEETYEGLEITSPSGNVKFIRVYPRLEGISPIELPAPDCNALPLVPIVPRRSDFVIIPVYVELVGPSVASECGETGEYYIQTSKKVDYDVEYVIARKHVTTDDDDFGEVVGDLPLVVPAGETRSNSFREVVKNDNITEDSEQYSEVIENITIPPEHTGEDEFILMRDRVNTLIPKQDPSSLFVNTTSTVMEGGYHYINITANIPNSCDDSYIKYSIKLVDGSAKNNEDYLADEVEMKSIDSDDWTQVSLSQEFFDEFTPEDTYRIFRVPTKEDDSDEEMEDFDVVVSVLEASPNISEDSQQEIVSKMWITDDGGCSISAFATPVVIEGGNIEITVMAPYLQGDQTENINIEIVDVTTDSSDYSSFRYKDDDSEVEFPITLNSEETSKTIYLPTIDDGSDEGQEQVDFIVYSEKCSDVNGSGDGSATLSSIIIDKTSDCMATVNYVPIVERGEDADVSVSFTTDDSKQVSIMIDHDVSTETPTDDNDIDSTVVINGEEIQFSFGEAIYVNSESLLTIKIPTLQNNDENSDIEYFKVSIDTGGCEFAGSSDTLKELQIGILKTEVDIPCVAILVPPPPLDQDMQPQEGKVILTPPKPGVEYLIEYLEEYSSARYSPDKVSGEWYFDEDSGSPNMDGKIVVTTDDSGIARYHARSTGQPISAQFMFTFYGPCAKNDTPAQGQVVGFSTPAPVLPGEVDIVERKGVVLSFDGEIGKVGCTGNPSVKSGISPSEFGNISDLYSIDPDTGKQEYGEVPGAATLSLRAGISKLTEEGVLETGILNICAVLGAIDGCQDSNGDILAQKKTKDNIPECSTEVIYIGPDSSFVGITDYSRDGDTSVFDVDIVKAVSKAQYVEGGTGQFLGAQDVVIARDGDSVDELAKQGKVVVHSIGTPGALFALKHSGTDPFWPIVQTYGGSEATEMVTGSHIISSGLGPIPVVTFSATDKFSGDSTLGQGNWGMIINKKSITFLLKDMKAPLSQNRDVKYQWDII